MLRARCLFPGKTPLCPQLHQTMQELWRLQSRSSCLKMGFPCCLGECISHKSAATARATAFIQGTHGKTSFSASGVTSIQNGPATAKAADHLHQHRQKNIVEGTALKDTSNRSTMILHVSILKPSDLISWPAKKEQKTGLSLHAVPRHLPKLLESSVTSVYTLALTCFCVIGGFFRNWQDGFFTLVWFFFFCFYVTCT